MSSSKAHVDDDQVEEELPPPSYEETTAESTASLDAKEHFSNTLHPTIKQCTTPAADFYSDAKTRDGKDTLEESRDLADAQSHPEAFTGSSSSSSPSPPPIVGSSSSNSGNLKGGFFSKLKDGLKSKAGNSESESKEAQEQRQVDVESAKAAASLPPPSIDAKYEAPASKDAGGSA